MVSSPCEKKTNNFNTEDGYRYIHGDWRYKTINNTVVKFPRYSHTKQNRRIEATLRYITRSRRQQDQAFEQAGSMISETSSFTPTTRQNQEDTTMINNRESVHLTNINLYHISAIQLLSKAR